MIFTTFVMSQSSNTHIHILTIGSDSTFESSLGPGDITGSLCKKYFRKGGSMFLCLQYRARFDEFCLFWLTISLMD